MDDFRWAIVAFYLVILMVLGFLFIFLPIECHKKKFYVKVSEPVAEETEH